MPERFTMDSIISLLHVNEAGIDRLMVFSGLYISIRKEKAGQQSLDHARETTLTLLKVLFGSGLEVFQDGFR